MYDVGGKLMNGIKSMYVHSLACVKIKGWVKGEVWGRRNDIYRSSWGNKFNFCGRGSSPPSLFR